MLFPFTASLLSLSPPLTPPAYEQPESPSSGSSSKAPGGLSRLPEYTSVQGGTSSRAPNMTAIPRDRSVAKTRSGSFGFGKDGVELSMIVADNLVFLYPNANDGSYTDTEVAGHVPRATFIVSITLSIAESMPRPPPIESLTVQLRGLESLGFPQGGLEQNIILYATKKVEEARDLELVPGSAYRWEVPIEISHDAAPYERMRYGRVFQKMSVHLKWSTPTRTKMFLSKYKDLSVERDVWIATIPQVSNMLDYAQTHRTENEHLGPMVIHVRSHHLTVGSHLRLGLYMPLLLRQRNLKVLSMTLSIIQSTTLHSRKRSGMKYRDSQPEIIPFLSVSGDEFEEKMRGGGGGGDQHQNQDQNQNQHASWIARLPFCHQIRPSTLTGSTGAAIRVSHAIEVSIDFVPEGHTEDKPLTYAAHWPVILPSCTCRWRSLKLPSYSQVDPSPLPYGAHEADIADVVAGSYRGRLQSHLDQNDCSCGIPIEGILKFEDEYEEAQHTRLTDLMSQELLADAITTPPAWEGREDPEPGDTATTLSSADAITQ